MQPGGRRIRNAPLIAGERTFFVEYIEVPKGSRIIFPTGSYNADGTPKQDKLQPGHNSVYVAYADLGRAIDAFDSKHYSKLKVTSDGQ